MDSTNNLSNQDLWVDLSGSQILDISLGDISDLNSFSIDIVAKLRIIIIGLVLLPLYVGLELMLSQGVLCGLFIESANDISGDCQAD